eukprot:TRINITY_DN3451_c0_g2_i1.p1 TRINITY_DN3451_c0_g2~~TRINITY_DN3451_c0_g2_i1.p1  ORF type:complete len:560 (-),score=85.50 TRINITY_DN3451_c0_g2_i1:92-1771(-)
MTAANLGIVFAPNVLSPQPGFGNTVIALMSNTPQSSALMKLLIIHSGEILSDIPDPINRDEQSEDAITESSSTTAIKENDEYLGSWAQCFEFIGECAWNETDAPEKLKILFKVDKNGAIWDLRDTRSLMSITTGSFTEHTVDAELKNENDLSHFTLEMDVMPGNLVRGHLYQKRDDFVEEGEVSGKLIPRGVSYQYTGPPLVAPGGFSPGLGGYRQLDKFLSLQPTLLPPKLDATEKPWQGEKSDWTNAFAVPEANQQNTPFHESLPVVDVTIISGENLLKADRFGKSDPYVIIRLGGTRDSPGVVLKSKVINKTLNPKWNQTWAGIVIPKPPLSMQIRCFDEDIGKDDFLGETEEVDLCNDWGLSRLGDAKTEWLDLSLKGRLRVQISVRSSLQFPPLPGLLPGFGSRDWLHGSGKKQEAHVRLTVYQALSLPVNGALNFELLHTRASRKAKDDDDSDGDENIVVSKAKSKIVRGTFHPHWADSFQFSFQLGDHFSIRIRDQKDETVATLKLPDIYAVLLGLALPLEKQEWFDLKAGRKSPSVSTSRICIGFQAVNKF